MIPGDPDLCPECTQGKHQNCDGESWDFEKDELTACDCYTWGHEPGR